MQVNRFKRGCQLWLNGVRPRGLKTMSHLYVLVKGRESAVRLEN